jgi:hypothetical protein
MPTLERPDDGTPVDSASARFVTVSTIRADDASTWDGRALLTFDLDWACDEVIADTIDLVEQAGVAATWFVTHDTPLLARLRANPSFEIGIHPNFLFLFEGDGRNGTNAEEVVDRLLTIVPEAKAVRSHSLVQSGRLLELFARKGLTHDCNAFIPAAHDLWSDPIGSTPPGLEGYDFHPIHVFLNTERMERYEATRQWHRAPAELIQHRHRGAGARTALLRLLSAACGVAKGEALA